MRVRLTALVVAVAAISMFLASTVGLSRIEAGLVDDVLDDAAAQSLLLDSVVLDDGGFVDTTLDDGPVIEPVMINDASFIVEGLDDLVRQLEASDGVDVVLSEMGRTRAEGLPVLFPFGLVVVAGLDGQPSEVLDVEPRQFEGALAAELNLQELAFADVYPEVFDLGDPDIAGLGPAALERLFEERLAEAARSTQVAATSFEVDGIDFVVAADVSDVSRSTAKIRDVLLFITPVLIVVSAIVTWVLTGRALAPVRRISRQVDAISGGTLDERVPVPRSGDEIQELGVTMNNMLDRLEDDDQRLRQFVSDASHELRSPVAVLRSEAEVALRSPDETTTTELADGVVGESIRLERIVNDLLVLARGDEDRGPQHVTAIDLDDIALDEAARRRRVPVDATHVSAGQVQGTEEGCTRILVHLLDNAARHAESKVAVGLHTDDARVTVWVDDDGPGIDPADRDRVFGRFVRLESARTRDTGGAGLGLAVVAATVQAMHGRIEVREAPLGGARFVATFPAATPV